MAVTCSAHAHAPPTHSPAAGPGAAAVPSLRSLTADAAVASNPIDRSGQVAGLAHVARIRQIGQDSANRTLTLAPRSVAGRDTRHGCPMRPPLDAGRWTGRCLSVDPCQSARCVSSQPPFGCGCTRADSTDSPLPPPQPLPSPPSPGSALCPPLPVRHGVSERPSHWRIFPPRGAARFHVLHRLGHGAGPDTHMT